MKVIYEAGLDQLIKHIKTALNGKEPTFSKNSGFNKTKTDAVENDTNKLFTAKGAYDLKNTITTAYTSLVNTTKSALETSINTKLSHGGYSGTAQSLKTDIDSKLPNPGFGGVHELGRYLDLHLSGSTADYDARIFVGSDKTVSMTNSNGTFEFGPKNTTHCHLYTDRASFYFNKELMINGNRAYHLGFKPTKDDVGLGNVTNIASSSSIDSNSTTTNATTSSIWRLRQMKASEYKDITVGGDANTYYPVVINVNGGCHDFWRFSVSRGYSWPAPNTWNNSTHKGGLTLSMMWSGDGGWGGNDHSLRVVQFNETYTTMVARLDLLKVGVVVWLRGGGAQYRINSDTGSNTTAVVHLGNLEDSDGAIYTPLTAINSNSIMNKFPIRNDGALYVNNNRVYHEGYKPTKTDVGLSNVDNIADSSKNVLSATRFTTARTINGTNFDGTGNITTANWGTARNLQIGNTAKSVNGSGNVTWSLAEIGASATSHTHNNIVSRGNISCENGVTARPGLEGISMQSVYNNGYPTSYGNVISLKGVGDGQILIGWSGSDGGHAPAYIRNKRDNASTANWSPWEQIYTTAYKPSKADVGLGSVNNWGASSSISANSTTEYATTNMVAQLKSNIFDRDEGNGGLNTLFDSNRLYAGSVNNDTTSLGSIYPWGAHITGGGRNACLQLYSPHSGGNQLFFRRRWSSEKGTWYKIYHEGFKPSAADVGALPSTYCPYRVGDILTTKNTANPAVTWPGTTWKKIEGRFLYGSSTAGQTGGSSTKTLSVANMPSHNHGASGSSGAAGDHSHTANHNHSASQTAHAHTQPSHSHTGNLCYPYNGGGNINPVGNASGYGTWTSSSAGGDNTGSATPAVTVNTANVTTSGGGSHSHSISVSIGSAGSGSAFDIMPPYETVHIWERLS